MGDKKQLSPKEMKEFYFGFQSVIGITKHMGGLRATEELIELCHMDEDKHVLEVGCGLGRTSCYLAKRRGCRVIGVDISERMIERAKGRVKKEGIENRVEFRVADAQDLPFKDALFDAVIGESVTAFVEDKQKAISEYVRVTKPGGYVGLNECIWIKAPPPRLAEYLSRIIGAEFPASVGWEELLKGSGLRNVEVRTHKISALGQWSDEIRQFDFKEFLEAWCKFFSMYIESPTCRRYAKEALRMPENIFNVFKYFGYGIYVGRKYGSKS